ncbi:MAG: hypothetical protein IT204_10625 [Fimbriimonadaceae bacterium]|nr:hypothetical protein [Fimbriimonadaceae bacterium]
MSHSQPQVLGLQPSFGFGDRLGLATPGHAAAVAGSRFAPIFAQQSSRELTRTQRTPEAVLAAAQAGVAAVGWDRPWGADGDHLKTPEDVARMAAAGFCFFTIDPSAYVENRADGLHAAALDTALDEVIAAGAFESVAQLDDLYLGRPCEVAEGLTLTFDRAGLLHRAAVKYGRAVQHAATMAAAIATASSDRPSEIELSVDETDTPTTTLEHLFVGLELRRRRVRVVSLAPRFVGEFEKGIDYKGDLAAFEASLAEQVAVARYCGPYKISIHSGSDKFGIYPSIGRLCGDLLHVKTAGTSYLEALRTVIRARPALFGEIASYALGRYPDDMASYHVSADLRRIRPPAGLTPAELEAQYLVDEGGRQVLHVTFGSVLTLGQTAAGQGFRDAILDVLREQPDLHTELVAAHLGKHIRLLEAG